MTFVGGAVFWVLLALAAVAVIVYFGRLFEFRRAQVNCQDFLKGVFNVLDAGNVSEALAICDELSAPVAQVVATAISNRNESEALLRESVDSQGRSEVARLDRRLSLLAIIGQIAPLLGLLGTVIGFIKAVLAANAQTLVSSADLLGGAMEALVSTAFGIVVAIFVVAMYGSLRSRLDRIVIDLEGSASQIVGYLASRETKGAAK